MTNPETVILPATRHAARARGTFNANPDQSRQCQFCGRVFARQDSLRRHYNACSKKEKHRLIPPEKRGRKRRACDLCHSQKIQCDARLPCNRCSVKDTVCTYGSFNSGTSDVLAATESGSDLALIETCGVNPPDDRCPVPFLYSYTDPRFESITYAFAASEAHVEAIFDEEADTTAHADTDILGNYRKSSIIQTRAQEIIAALVNHHRQHAEPGQHNKASDSFDFAARVFTVQNLPRYVSAYFNYFHPHIRFIHRPTFSIETSSLPLLLAVTLAGAAHSPPTDDVLSAHSLYSLAEEFIFARLQEACVIAPGRQENAIETAQAAILISSLLYSSNDRATAWRGLYHRSPVFVASVRRLGLMGTRRTVPLQEMSWTQFIAEESRIRLVTSVFVSNCINTLSFNSIPQVAVAEMEGDTPASDALFEATTETEFMRLRCDVNLSASDRSLKDWIALYLHDEWNSVDKVADELEPSGLTQHILALLSVIYSARTNLLSTSSHTALIRALDRWKNLYDLVYSRQVRTQLVGFVKYSTELCWLGRKLLQMSKTDGRSGRYYIGVPTDSLADLRGFLEDSTTAHKRS